MLTWGEFVSIFYIYACEEHNIKGLKLAMPILSEWYKYFKSLHNIDKKQKKTIKKKSIKEPIINDEEPLEYIYDEPLEYRYITQLSNRVVECKECHQRFMIDTQKNLLKRHFLNKHNIDIKKYLFIEND